MTNSNLITFWTDSNGDAYLALPENIIENYDLSQMEIEWVGHTKDNDIYHMLDPRYLPDHGEGVGYTKEGLEYTYDISDSRTNSFDSGMGFDLIQFIIFDPSVPNLSNLDSITLIINGTEIVLSNRDDDEGLVQYHNGLSLDDPEFYILAYIKGDGSTIIGYNEYSNGVDQNMPIGIKYEDIHKIPFKYLDLSNIEDNLADVAYSGDYYDLSNRPSLATVATSGSYNDLTNKPNFATVATSGSYNDLTNKPNFAAVATSGNYNDLTNYAGKRSGSGEIFNDYTNNKANAPYAHAEGSGTSASANYSHAEGRGTTASGVCSHAEGETTRASGSYSHAEGESTTASGQRSHAEGYHTTASGQSSHAEGLSTLSDGYMSHAEGNGTTASGGTDMFGGGSHAEGINTYAKEQGSHAEGRGTTASGVCSHVEGYQTYAAGQYQHVQGKYNIVDTSNTYAHIVGGGTSDSERKNIHTLDWSGNAVYAGQVSATKFRTAQNEGSAATAGTTTYVNTVEPSTVYMMSKANGTMDGEHRASLTSDGLHFGYDSTFSGNDYAELSNQRLVLSGYVSTSTGNAVIGGGTGTVLRTTTITPSGIQSRGITMPISSTAGAKMSVESQLFTLDPSYGESGKDLLFGVSESGWRIAPETTGQWAIGSSTKKFTNIYATNGTIQTSDEREKDIFESFDEDKYSKLFMDLKPIKYTWKNKDVDTYAHLGLGAQTTELALLKNSLEDENLSFVQHTFDEDGNDYYGMDYGDANILTLMMTQKQEKKIKELEEEIQSLKEQINLLQILAK